MSSLLRQSRRNQVAPICIAQYTIDSGPCQISANSRLVVTSLSFPLKSLAGWIVVGGIGDVKAPLNGG